jgi:hypothetical protein
MRLDRIPEMTVDQCLSITGNEREHAAHTVYTTRVLYHGIQNVPIGRCPGRHEYTNPAQPEDPFHGLD